MNKKKLTSIGFSFQNLPERQKEIIREKLRGTHAFQSVLIQIEFKCLWLAILYSFSWVPKSYIMKKEGQLKDLEEKRDDPLKLL